jgi:hypothetical protein
MLRGAVRGLEGEKGRIHRVRAVAGQFRRPAYPGDVFVTDVWRTSRRDAALRLRAAGRTEPLVANGVLEYEP